MKLERRLAFLGTLGNNAPFIGLFGTVIGVVSAFEALGEPAKTPLARPPRSARAASRHGGIAEALVATAVGLAVAIPAVATYNFFQRMIKSTLANTEALTRMLLAHLKAEPARREAPTRRSPDGSSESPRRAKKAETDRTTTRRRLMAGGASSATTTTG